MSNVVDFKTKDGLICEGVTINPDDVLTGAIGKGFEHVVVIGRTANGDLDVRGSHGAPESYLLIGLATHFMQVQNS